MSTVRNFPKKKKTANYANKIIIIASRASSQYDAAADSQPAAGTSHRNQKDPQSYISAWTISESAHSYDTPILTHFCNKLHGISIFYKTVGGVRIFLAQTTNYHWLSAFI